MTRLLALDVGSRRIGLAVADTDSCTVRPLITMRRADDRRDAATLGRVISEQDIDELVVGLPLKMDGSEGVQAAATREWAAAVAEPIGLPISWRDERLTSQAAELRIGVARRGRSGGPPSPAARNAHRARIDREAASSIAQAELDARLSAEREA